MEKGSLGSSLDALEVSWRVSWDLLAGFWNLMTRLVCVLGVSWEALGSIFDTSGDDLDTMGGQWITGTTVQWSR